MTKIPQKLLILGATVNEISIVKKAKSMGLYTIVTDNHIDWSLAPAKTIADEAWNISWSDIESLAKKSKEVGVDGVIAGFSEFRVESMVRLCQALSLPCYINEEQLEITRNKVEFKKWCASHDIPVVKEYRIQDQNIRYPVIIKPVDRAGGIGINVAYSKSELTAYYEQALTLSPSGKVIIEEFINNGSKFDCYYVINNSHVDLMCTTDTIMYSGFDKGFEKIQKAWLYPSRYEKAFIRDYHPKFVKMIESLHMENGYTSISCFYRNKECLVFEAGFRLTGGQSFNYQNAVTGADYLESMINYSLGLPVANYNHPNGTRKAITFHLYGIVRQEETIKDIAGLEAICETANVISVIPQVLIGQQLNPGNPIKLLSITILYDNVKEAVQNIDLFEKSFCLITKSGDKIHACNRLSEEEVS
jgi:biotin carboxylase